MKKTKSILALAIALFTCLTCFASVAFAADHAEGTPGNPAQAAITKHLQLPKGTKIPTVDFEFEVEKVTVDGIAGSMPTIGNNGKVTISFSDKMTPTYTEDVLDITHIYMESANLLATVTGSNAWPHAGEYVYKITETEKTYAAIDEDHEIMEYSQAEYTMTVWVKETALNSGVYYAASIFAVRNVLDDGTEAPKNDKVNPEPKADGKYSGMVFTNAYVHTNGTDDIDNPDPTDPAEATLTISKAVDGTYASTSVAFTFKVTVNEPAFVNEPKPDLPGTYTAYIVGPGSTIAGTVEFPDGTEKSFTLKHGQKLVFVNTPVGTTYDVKETGTAAYKAEANITSNGVSEGAVTGALGADAEFLHRFVGEAANTAAFTNIREEVTPTGLNINDLPFIGMIVLALAAVAVVAVVKARKRKLCTQN